MAQNNIEVEIKTKISKSLFEKLKKDLTRTAKFVKSSHHIDDYYVPKFKNFLAPKYPYQWLSVRTRDAKTTLNYKCWYPKGVKNTKYCDEYEIAVDNPKQLELILTALEIYKKVSVDKKREVYVYKDKYEIALDKVKKLGFFIEIEAMKNKKNLESTHRDLTEFAKTLGVNKIVMVPGGYATEMLRRSKKKSP